MKVKFYVCKTCGNIVELIKNGGGELVCCESPMKELVPNTTDAAHEKHVPVATRIDGEIHVQVGSVEHPMTEQHYIEWIAVISKDRSQRIVLAPGDEPKAIFCDASEAEIYAYCNLHGLWMTKV